MSLVQSNRAPDLLTIDDERDEGGEKTGHTIAKVGSLAVRVAPFSNDTIIIPIADLRRLLVGNYQLGWSGHLLHCQTALQSTLKELGR